MFAQIYLTHGAEARVWLLVNEIRENRICRASAHRRSLPVVLGILRVKPDPVSGERMQRLVRFNANGWSSGAQFHRSEVLRAATLQSGPEQEAA